MTTSMNIGTNITTPVCMRSSAGSGSCLVPEAVREDAWAVYRSIADAESRVHGAPVDQIHFHEVGTLDALADVVGVCWLMHRLAPDAVYASPVHVGSGQAKCAHGILPVPAPATALLLEESPAMVARCAANSARRRARRCCAVS